MKTPLALLVASTAFIACSPPGPTDPDLNCAGTGSATTASIQPMLTMRCGLAGCHDPMSATYGDFSAEAKTAMVVNKKSLYAGMAGSLLIVEPKKLENSALWLKVLGGATKGRTGPKGENVFGAMPNDGTTLDATQQKQIKDWICSGAM